MSSLSHSLGFTNSLVCLDILKANLRLCEYFLAQSLGQCWQKSFSAYLAVSRLLQREPSISEPFRHDRDGRLEIQGSWSRQSLYFQNGGGVCLLFYSCFHFYYLPKILLFQHSLFQYTFKRIT